MPLLGESTKGKQTYFSLLMTAKVVVSYIIYPTRIIVFQISNVFVLSLHAEQRYFCPKHCLNFTDLSPSGPARRFAEPDLGLNCLYDHSQTFSF